jgi:nucleoside-diphosphate-sugar epimerase
VLPTGFGRIGIPVTRLIEASGVEAVHLHFGTVYGPGKAFAARIVPGLKKGRMPVVGDGRNRAPLTSVLDAARSIVHLATLPREQVAGQRFLITDGASTTQREFLDLIAEFLGAPRPPQIPAWLARLAIGAAMVEVLTLDVRVDNSRLLGTGFRLSHPAPRDGIGPMLEQLGHRMLAAPAGSS